MDIAPGGERVADGVRRGRIAYTRALIAASWAAPTFSMRRSAGGNRVTFFWDGDVIVIENHCHHDILKGYK